PEARDLILTLQAEVAELRAKVRALQQQVHDLKERRNQNSSSRPISTDLSTVKRRPPRPVSGRKPGGQPGHERRQRALLPPDHTKVLKPTQSRRCGQALAGHDPRPWRHQVLERPPLGPEVTEYQLPLLRCPGCGLSTCASLPAGVPTGGQGPRLQAVLALMTGAQVVETSSLFCGLFGLRL